MYYVLNKYTLLINSQKTLHTLHWVFELCVHH